VTSVFSARGDQVEVERWDGHLNTLSTAAHAAGFLRIYGMSDKEASAAASTLDLPLTMTMRGCIIYATKAP
jgi:hypothetical protein